jgi:hypothetical protein
VLVCCCALGRLGGCIPCLVRLCCCDIVCWLQTIPEIVEAGTMFRYLKKGLSVFLEARASYAFFHPMTGLSFFVLVNNVKHVNSSMSIIIAV